MYSSKILKLELSIRHKIINKKKSFISVNFTSNLPTCMAMLCLINKYYSLMYPTRITAGIFHMHQFITVCALSKVKVVPYSCWYILMSVKLTSSLRFKSLTSKKPKPTSFAIKLFQNLQSLAYHLI